MLIESHIKASCKHSERNILWHYLSIVKEGANHTSLLLYFLNIAMPEVLTRQGFELHEWHTMSGLPCTMQTIHKPMRHMQRGMLIAVIIHDFLLNNIHTYLHSPRMPAPHTASASVWPKATAKQLARVNTMRAKVVLIFTWKLDSDYKILTQHIYNAGLSAVSSN